jgi:hypothetical protein
MYSLRWRREWLAAFVPSAAWLSRRLPSILADMHVLFSMAWCSQNSESACALILLCAAASTMTADAMPFTPDPTNSSCQLYTTRAGDSLTRLSAQGRIGVTRILKDNWGSNALPLPGTLKPGLRIRLCNMPVTPSGETILACVNWPPHPELQLVLLSHSAPRIVDACLKPA